MYHKILRKECMYCVMFVPGRLDLGSCLLGQADKDKVIHLPEKLPAINLKACNLQNCKPLHDPVFKLRRLKHFRNHKVMTFWPFAFEAIRLTCQKYKDKFHAIRFSKVLPGSSN